MHFETCKYLLSLAAAACRILDVCSPQCGQQVCTSLGHDWVEAGSRHTATATLILVTGAVAVVFNGGTRGCNLARAWQESATADEKAIWEELAYWHQAWRQEKAVRSETPNDGSSWTAAHYSKSFFLSQCPCWDLWCFSPSSSPLALVS